MIIVQAAVAVVLIIALGFHLAEPGVVGLMVIVLATAAIGILVFGLLTRRLKRLSREMRRVSDSGFEISTAIAPAAPEHSVSRGWTNFEVHDEPYTRNWFGKRPWTFSGSEVRLRPSA